MYSDVLWGGIINYEREKQFTHTSPCITRKLTSEEKKELEEARKKKESTPNGIGISNKAVYHLNGYYDAREGGRICLVKEKLEKLLKDGKTQDEIADFLHIAYDVVGRYIEKWDLVDIAVINEENASNKESEEVNKEVGATVEHAKTTISNTNKEKRSNELSLKKKTHRIILEREDGSDVFWLMDEEDGELHEYCKNSLGPYGTALAKHIKRILFPWPQKGDPYFYVDSCWGVKSGKYGADAEQEEKLIKTSNFFEKRKTAEETAEKIRNVLRNTSLLAQKGKTQ